MYWSTGSGRIQLNIPKKVAESCYHSGQCDNDVKIARQMKSIKKQLDSIPKELLISELKEYGAWDSEELDDYEANKDRILWLACGDIFDEC
jgi:hypothetical protein